MKSRIIIGAVIIVLGLLLAVGPQTIFPVCGVHGYADSAMSMEDDAMGHDAMSDDGASEAGHSGNGSKMKCYWTGQAEIGAGLVIAVIGIFLLIFKERNIRAGLSLSLVPLGIYALLIPNLLIGVCGSAHMECRTLALPAITIISAAVSVVSAVNVFLLLKAEKERLD